MRHIRINQQSVRKYSESYDQEYPYPLPINSNQSRFKAIITNDLSLLLPIDLLINQFINQYQSIHLPINSNQSRFKAIITNDLSLLLPIDLLINQFINQSFNQPIIHAISLSLHHSANQSIAPIFQAANHSSSQHIIPLFIG